MKRDGTIVGEGGGVLYVGLSWEVSKPCLGVMGGIVLEGCRLLCRVWPTVRRGGIGEDEGGVEERGEDRGGSKGIE